MRIRRREPKECSYGMQRPKKIRVRLNSFRFRDLSTVGCALKRARYDFDSERSWRGVIAAGYMGRPSELESARLQPK